MKNVQNQSIIAIGSNLLSNKGNLEIILPAMVENVKSRNIEIESKSALYSTPAVPIGSGPDFLNAAIMVKSTLNAHEMLAILHEIEEEFGRVRPYRWAPRVLDLDLIFHNDEILPDEEVWQYWANLSLEEAQKQMPKELILPHPSAHKRAFVLAPLQEIKADYVHPVLQKTVQTLWDELPNSDRAEIKRL